MSIDKITPLDTFVSNDAPICYGILKPGDHYKHGIPVIKVKNIVGGKILEDDLLKTTPEIHAQYKRAEVKEGDILLTIRGTTGRVAIVPNSLNGANITQDTARIRVSSNDDSLYIFYALQSFNVQQQITLNTVGQAVKGINIAEVKKLKIYHPILDEQKKIAQILSTWDQAILTTEKLLENSQQQKKALMQQLLTGKKRLLDENGRSFSEQWQSGHLVDIAKISKGKALSSKDLKSGSYPVIAGGKTSPYTHSEYTHENVITVSASGAYAGYVAFYPYKIWASDCSVVSNKIGSDISFIYQLLISMQTIIYSLQSGGAQPHIYPKDIESLKVFIPPLVEQQKIAKVFAVVDQEVDTLQKKLECLKQEKKALMQQLLTGKKRVKVVV
ncbi:restriction endonuclease subunit S [Acinetobacter baumannii]|uniref:restriction endonuclease subunit S n=1 Tax=Acinetobacter calcoaceticus/baumannii complex TaxID=909768 RepID=UPI00112BB34B|nr:MULTISPECIES: restriction endonuclease subunit S [Acinetobacter calcoaceticus/baumannii complex]MCT9254211.1 restriction endonuclease subunit S [Acinetobacter baumannii]MDP7809935.1 restriction endonuclease subunit S [Acinetobacter baumannii]MEB6625697.1 restriction endonuclease subunit S [Acinetobacter pittii]TPU91398.1 restriction endonuclease subunit S [Acinetobacter baumannii]BBT50241.1 type I restriction modification enzyme, S subunit [Acinetobacter baumannii]